MAKKIFFGGSEVKKLNVFYKTYEKWRNDFFKKKWKTKYTILGIIGDEKYIWMKMSDEKYPYKIEWKNNSDYFSLESKDVSHTSLLQSPIGYGVNDLRIKATIVSC